MGWKQFADRLAFLLMFLIPGLWVVNHWLVLPGEVIGATIVAWTLVIQFYFRKKDPDPPTPAP